MYTTVKYKLIKPEYVDKSSRKLLNLFFKDWLDTTSIQYTAGSWDSLDEIAVDFDNIEDALVIRLKGIPPEFQNHIKIL